MSPFAYSRVYVCTLLIIIFPHIQLVPIILLAYSYLMEPIMMKMKWINSGSRWAQSLNKVGWWKIVHASYLIQACKA